MQTVRRLTAWLTTAVLLLQALQGSGVLCMAHPSDRPTLSRVSHAGHDIRAGLSRMGAASDGDAMGMSHDAGAAASRSARASGADPQPLAKGMPSDIPSRHGNCPDRESPRACSTMTACATAAALPTFTMVAVAPEPDAGVVAAHLTQPPPITRAPELPPPRA